LSWALFGSHVAHRLVVALTVSAAVWLAVLWAIA
jgi:hypothetical protein